ncbi:hypothetical protein Arub01_55790 [Actinomadura rubrobrunea]|uniref:Uncharacterized protein n=2 Tax=Actinomadura rubrobrunea TaxID=115335 RepID=A0A9W6UX54_9ACTN|nr:SAM-dependent methyltransferase [Actinomadura rubrobrunea]GLW67336.1 hypothetical protein Arub01_55790 [Actinomadura rubrobrunea]
MSSPTSADSFVSVPEPASVARMYDYYLGGKDNYEVDREAAERILAKASWLRPIARHNRWFLARAVRHCLKSGIRQVVDIGTGFPTSPSPWEVARDIAPETRVIGVDNDETVLAHARTRQVEIIKGDLRDPNAILDRLDGLVDWSRPVALTLAAVLHFLTEDDDPAGCVRAFRNTMAPGSRLVISHISRDGTPGRRHRSDRTGVQRQRRRPARVPHQPGNPELVRRVHPGGTRPGTSRGLASRSPVRPGLVHHRRRHCDAGAGRGSSRRTAGGIGDGVISDLLTENGAIIDST